MYAVPPIRSDFLDYAPESDIFDGIGPILAGFLGSMPAPISDFVCMCVCVNNQFLVPEMPTFN